MIVDVTCMLMCCSVVLFSAFKFIDCFFVFFFKQKTAYEMLRSLVGSEMCIRDRISTVAVGVTASFGTVLLAAGTKGQRYALPHATIHMHQPLGGAQGQASDIEIQAREILRLKARLNEILSASTGQPLSEIEKDTERDFYLDAKDAVEYGLVDQVLTPPQK